MCGCWSTQAFLQGRSVGDPLRLCCLAAAAAGAAYARDLFYQGIKPQCLEHKPSMYNPRKTEPRASFELTCKLHPSRYSARLPYQNAGSGFVAVRLELAAFTASTKEVKAHAQRAPWANMKRPITQNSASTSTSLPVMEYQATGCQHHDITDLLPLPPQLGIDVSQLGIQVLHLLSPLPC